MLSKQQQIYVDAIISSAPTVGLDCNTPTFTREQLRAVSMIHKGKKWIPNWITHDQSRRAGRGVFTIPEVVTAYNEFLSVNAESAENATEVHEVTNGLGVTHLGVA